MKKILFLLIVLLLVTACATTQPEPTSTQIHPTNTSIPPTLTSIPPTDTPEPTSCEEGEGSCLELSFDGESCTYKGPTELNAGIIKHIFHNESGTDAYAGLVRLTGDKTIQDLIEYNGEEPSTKHAPSWVQILYEGRSVPAGESNIWKGLLEGGTYAMLCFSVTPHGAWLATGLTVDK